VTDIPPKELQPLNNFPYEESKTEQGDQVITMRTITYTYPNDPAQTFQITLASADGKRVEEYYQTAKVWFHADAIALDPPTLLLLNVGEVFLVSLAQALDLTPEDVLNADLNELIDASCERRKEILAAAVNNTRGWIVKQAGSEPSIDAITIERASQQVDTLLAIFAIPHLEANANAEGTGLVIEVAWFNGQAQELRAYQIQFDIDPALTRYDAALGPFSLQNSGAIDYHRARSITKRAEEKISINANVDTSGSGGGSGTVSGALQLLNSGRWSTVPGQSKATYGGQQIQLNDEPSLPATYTYRVQLLGMETKNTYRIGGAWNFNYTTAF
jgi:hypothetical protein